MNVTRTKPSRLSPDRKLGSQRPLRLLTIDSVNPPASNRNPQPKQQQQLTPRKNFISDCVSIYREGAQYSIEAISGQPPRAQSKGKPSALSFSASYRKLRCLTDLDFGECKHRDSAKKHGNTQQKQHKSTLISTATAAQSTGYAISCIPTPHFQQSAGAKSAGNRDHLV